MSTITAGTPLLSPEEIAVRAGERVSFLRLPQAGVFAERAIRLRQLAANHAMRDYLLFCAELVEVQDRHFKRPFGAALPTRAQVEAAANEGRPLFDPASWPRDGDWLGELRVMMQTLAERTPQGPARETILRLARADAEEVQQQADRLLNGVMLGLDLGTAPLIAAALQLHWTRLVTQTQAEYGGDRVAPFGRIDDPLSCPCCGSRPTASVTRMGAEGSGWRYLACSLCSTEWHYVRIKCTHCEGTKGISFQSLRGHEADVADDDTGQPAVEVECCDPCSHYLKIVHMERDQYVEPIADDLASLTLDMLISEAGFQRQGVNLMLLFGDPEPPPDPGGSS
ncbi:formate dehydrogenase accessory protein FdhE [Burkholderiaceae bacterium UC74_6]